MEPRIQYAKTSDGVNIAFSVMGEGETLISLPPHGITHLQFEWQIPEMRLWYERLARQRTLVRYDGRGTGLSDRGALDFSLDARMLDLEAVVDALDAERFALFAAVHGGPLAIAFAVRYPERVSRLVFWCAYARVSDFTQSHQVQAIRGMIETDWQTYTEAAAHALATGWDAGDMARRQAELFREGSSADAMKAYIEATRDLDVMDLVSQIKVPTLVLHRRQLQLLSVDVASRLAANIPGARLTLLEGEALLPFIGEIDATLAAIDDFLGESTSMGAPALHSGTAIILFADIVDSTGLTERLGDTAFRDKARGLDEAMRTAIRDNGGTAVEGKTLGDGVLAVFTSAKQAIGCAQACHEAASAAGLSLHVGIHAGDVIREAGNVYGGAVNIAARVAAASAAGETLVSGTVRDLARTSAGVTFEDRGKQALKGIDEPVRVFAVRQA